LVRGDTDPYVVISNVQFLVGPVFVLSILTMRSDEAMAIKRLGMGKFTSLCAVAVMIYHSVNFCHRSLGFYLRAKRDELSLRIDGGKRTLLRMPLISELVFRSRQHFDFSSESLAGMGYAARYILSDIPDFIYERPFQNKTQLFMRDELLFEKAGIEHDVFPNMKLSLERLREYCRASHLRLVVAVIPTKLSVLYPSSASRHVYQAIQNSMPGEKNDLLDLYLSYQALHPEEPLFLPYDNHWSSFGIALTAQSLLKQITAAQEEAWIKADGTYNLDPQTSFTGALQLPQFFRNRFWPFAWRENFYVIDSPPSRTYEKTPPKLFLAGTSFAKRLSDSPFGLASLLRRGLGAEVSDFSVDGGGKYAALHSLLENNTARDGILVWEFPLFEALQNDVLKVNWPASNTNKL
jgi:SGNH hydrolase-like domain, acetyltransferase AlgX